MMHNTWRLHGTRCCMYSANLITRLPVWTRLVVLHLGAYVHIGIMENEVGRASLVKQQLLLTCTASSGAA